MGSAPREIDGLLVPPNKASGPRPLGPKEIDGLLVPPGKACSLLTDHHWLTAQV